VHPVGVLDAVRHRHCDLLPGLEAEVTKLQQRLVLGLIYRADHCAQLSLEINEPVNLRVDLIFGIHDFEDNVLHAAYIRGIRARHIRKRASDFARQPPKRNHLLQFCIDSLIDPVRLGEILLGGHFAAHDSIHTV